MLIPKRTLLDLLDAKELQRHRARCSREAEVGQPRRLCPAPAQDLVNKLGG